MVNLKGLFHPDTSNKRMSLKTIPNPEEDKRFEELIKSKSQPKAHQKTQKVLTPSYTTQVSAKIRKVNKLHIIHVNLNIDHFFKLVYDCYFIIMESLKTRQTRPSKPLSLAEWMHIHALFLQLKAEKATQLVKHNKLAITPVEVYLKAQIPVFKPIAEVLNSIGTVENHLEKVLYVPFMSEPHQLQYTSQDIKEIMNGQMFDWGRSWTRVLEARGERLASQNYLTPPTSNPTTPQNGTPMRTPPTHPLIQTMSSSSSSRDIQSANIFEKARDLKDYTVYPPLTQSWNNYDFALFIETPKPDFGEFDFSDGFITPNKESSPTNSNPQSLNGSGTNEHIYGCDEELCGMYTEFVASLPDKWLKKLDKNTKGDFSYILSVENPAPNQYLVRLPNVEVPMNDISLALILRSNSDLQPHWHVYYEVETDIDSNNFLRNYIRSYM